MTELEWQTRRDRINTRLTSLPGPWRIVRFREGMDPASLSCHAVEEYPTANGPADYALFVNGRLLGIIEAKKVTIGPENVLEQAKRYFEGAPNQIGHWDRFRVPFLYSTNGEKIQFLDVRTPAILAKAFRGELVPQDPNDEPAEKLLARIRAARAAQDDSPRKRSRGASKSGDTERKRSATSKKQ